MFYSHAVRVLLDMVTETLVQVGQSYTLHEVVRAVFWSTYAPGEIVLPLKDYVEQRNIIESISVAESTIQRVFAWKNWMEQGYKKSVVVIEANVESTSVLLIAKVELLFP